MGLAPEWTPETFWINTPPSARAKRVSGASSPAGTYRIDVPTPGGDELGLRRGDPLVVEGRRRGTLEEPPVVHQRERLGADPLADELGEQRAPLLHLLRGES